MILVEMVHDARIIRLKGGHVPAHVRKWMGDSVGRWEGDTLVVETTNFTNKTRFRGSSENMKVIERFSRVDDDTILYNFTIDDPAPGRRRGPASIPGRRATTRSTSTPATKGITRWATSCAARGCSTRKGPPPRSSGGLACSCGVLKEADRGGGRHSDNDDRLLLIVCHCRL